MREFGPGHPLVYSHIPKTGGTSLKMSLAQSLHPQVFVRGVDRSLFGGYDDIGGTRGKARARIFATPEDLPGDATLVTGHIAPSTTLQRYPGAEHITVLRVPQVRVLSQWLHSRSLSEFDLREWGTAGQAMRLGRLPLADYLEQHMIAPNIDNTTVRFLIWPHPLLKQTEFIAEQDDDELVQAALARLDDFGFVDVAENKAHLDRLAEWLGRSLVPTRLNERTAVPPRARPDLATELGPATRELLDYRSRLDLQVWAHVVRRVLPDVAADAYARDTISTAVDRYADMLTRPMPRTRPVRRMVERIYDVGARFGRRRAPR